MLLHDALMFAGLRDITLVTEPEAAAVAYTASQHVEPGSAIGVYDLGGGTFDAAVVRQLANGGFELAGRPEGIDSLGGIDFDEAVFEQVRAYLGAAWTTLDSADPMVITAAAALRRECTEAKKALSSDTEVTIPVMLPGVSTQVRMVRSEFEQLIAPAIDATVDAMRRAIDAAGLTPADLSAVLLVGGSSRIPLVAQQVGAELDLPVTVDSDPKAVVAAGAALAISPRKELVPAQRRPLALLPSAESAEFAEPPRRSRRRAVYTLVGVSAFAAAMIGLAGMVGSDVRPLGDIAADQGIAAPALDEDGAGGTGTAKDGVDPWTGKPYTETTDPGPTRAGAKPTEATPAKLSPKPTKARDRGALINGATPPPAPGGGGDNTGGAGTQVPVGNESSAVPEPPVTTTTTEEPPPPPPVETTTTTEEPPPVEVTTTTTTEEPPPPPPENPPPAEEPVNSPSGSE
jgi:hypothetical protein